MKAGLFALAALLTLCQPVRADDPPLRSWTFDDDVVSIEKIAGGDGLGQDLLTIRRSGILIHAEIAPHIDFITSDQGAADTPKLVPITSAAARDLVIETFSGGAHCCFSIEVATLGDPFHISEPLDVRDAGAATFALPGNSLLGLRSADEAYAYRWTSFAASPAPELLLRYDTGKGFSLAADLMKKPPPSAEKLQQMMAAMRADAGWKDSAGSPPTAYLQAVLDLIYSGNLKTAQRYAAKAWPETVTGRQDFIDDLNQCALPSSPWWTSVAALNGIKPYDPAKDCKSD
jgi:hypothetical protein